MPKKSILFNFKISLLLILFHIGQGKFIDKEEKMEKRLLSVSLIWVVMGVSSLFAGSDQLAQLANRHAKLSQKIVQEYKHKNSASAIALIKELESGQKKLGNKVHNKEIANLLKYLNLCVVDMKKVVKQPYSRKNIHLVSDLSASLMEGNRYIAKAL
jgi:hypothetical protein